MEDAGSARADIGPPQALHILDGPFVVEQGQRIGVPEACERLVVFVALSNGRAVSRSHIAGTLWPNVVEERAAGNLRTALWRLRSAGIRALDHDRHSLRIHPRAPVDLSAVESWAGRLIDGSAGADDLSLRRFHPASIDLLPGWYDEWLDFERDRLRQRMLHALEELSGRLLALGRAGEALEAAMAAVEVDPLRESAQRAQIRVHLSEGNVVEARRTFFAFERLLDRELGLPPTRETALLARAWSRGPTPLRTSA